MDFNLHDGLDEEEVRGFWRKVVGNPKMHFYKTQWRRSSEGHRKNKLYRGVLSIYVHSANKAYYLEGLLQGL